MARGLPRREKGDVMINFPERFFVTGTDTEIGKTVVSTMLMCGLDATYWKPIQSGLEEETDTQFVQRVSRVSNDKIVPETYRLNKPMSPHASSDIDGVSISLSDFGLPEYQTKHLIVEGAGGLIVPINWEDTVLDLIEQLDIPVFLVARSSLGTLNHTLLSLKALRDRGIEVFGVILSGDIHNSNRETIAHFGEIPVFEIERLEEVSYKSLSEAFIKIFS